jgi:hypothetical protein
MTISFGRGAAPSILLLAATLAGCGGGGGGTGGSGGSGGSSSTATMSTGTMSTGTTSTATSTGSFSSSTGTASSSTGMPDCTTAANCDDGNACTVDTCNAMGQCVHAAVDPNDNDVCTTDTCDTATGVKNTPISVDDMDPCTADSCDPVTGPVHMPINLDDMDVCTLDSCRGMGPQHFTSSTLFSEGFADNSKGWTLGNEWQIGNATASTDDPGTDNTPTGDNGVAGVVLGGNYATGLHGYAYLTSPVINTTVAQGNVVLSFARWLDSDYPSYVTNDIEVYDGSAWQVLWVQPANAKFIQDVPPYGNGWVYPRFDVTQYANASFQVRFGFKIESAGVIARGGWNIDDVLVTNESVAADNNLCTTDSCNAMSGAVYTPIGIDDMVSCTVDACDNDNGISHTPSSALCNDNNACTSDTCDIVMGCSHSAVVCNDNDQCTSDTCDATQGCLFPALVYFNETFANNAQGWTLDNSWQIGSATASSGQNVGSPDPGSDHTSSADNGVAGVNIGGTTGTALHPPYYLTSPVIDLSAATGSVTLEYWRWLNTDYPPYESSTIEVFNGTSWVQIYANPSGSLVTDNAWTKVQLDVTAYKNAAFRVRWGNAITSAGVFDMSGWNIDDVRVLPGAPGACP